MCVYVNVVQKIHTTTIGKKIGVCCIYKTKQKKNVRNENYSMFSIHSLHPLLFVLVRKRERELEKKGYTTTN